MTSRNLPTESDEPLWGYPAAARFLGLTEAALRNLVHRGVIPFVRVSPRIVRFDSMELRAWLKSRTHSPRSTCRRERSR